VEDLLEGGLVDWEVVDGFVGSGREIWVERGLGEHVEDGAGVWAGERFALIMSG